MLASLVLAALPLSAFPAAAATAPVVCGDDEVTVVVDPNELGGATRVACAAGGGTASQLFEAVGFRLSAANAPGMQGYVCRINGRPDDGRCTQGDAYWSLWWSAADSDAWAYATLGVDALELQPGDRLAFAWHQGDGSATPPDLALPGGTEAGTPNSDEVVKGAGPVEQGEVGDHDDGVPGWLVAGAAVAVLGAAAVVPLRRRRQQ